MKQILIAIGIFFICTQAYSQVYIGLSSGASITKFSGKDQGLFKFNSLVRFNIGIPVLFKLNQHVGFESCISYINMGSTLKYDLKVIDPNDPIYLALKNTELYFALNYLSVPLTFNYSLPISKYSLYAKAGGYFSYALDANITNNKSDDKENFNLKDEKMRRTDLGLLVGIGGTRELGNGFIFLDARYMIGCSNLTTDKYYGLRQDAYNRGLFLNIGYMFNLGKAQ
ncbi:porin family protein [Cytophaga aurantiaca]|uniref:porin family protein n=1 Tax=Cytophaga aurantiaca TaxID=29530 RepID=UPI00037E9427|nr:porin family protein [Cytophaga aurantiaca]